MVEIAQIASPWSSLGFLSEGGLRAAQEYFFRTHASHSRMIADGRNAQGLMKSHIRRKLTQEMGEDFRMYTGMTIGEAQATAKTAGIRGEMNILLQHIHDRIAPGQPIASPIQEDLTILKHPHGALEVCYALVWFYTGLVKKHATLVGNRRKILKSILDEELFKWIWRMTLGYLQADPASKADWSDYNLTAGLSQIPAERQRVLPAAKLMEIGQFLLGKAVSESHLRLPLCYYFTVYLRNVQVFLVTQPGLPNLDPLYALITKRDPAGASDQVLVAIDALMHLRGNSTQTFETVLKNGDDVQRQIPAPELEFIGQLDCMGDEQRIAATVRAMVPILNREEIAAQGRATLMPLLLVLRSAAPAVRGMVLDRLTIPVMMLLSNRLLNGPHDEAAESLAGEIKFNLEQRAKRGETVSVRSINREGAAGVTTVAGAARRPAAGGPATSESAPAGGQAAPSGPDPIVEQGAGLLDRTAVISWKATGDQVSALTLSARNLMILVGRESALLLPWVRLAVQTGQIPAPPEGAQPKEWLEKVIAGLLRAMPAAEAAQPSPPTKAMLTQAAKGHPPQAFLLGVMTQGNLGPTRFLEPVLDGALVSLIGKLKDRFADFIRNPNQDEFKALRQTLNPAEKAAVAVLQRVDRLG
jgi:hypothetical protein